MKVAILTGGRSAEVIIRHIHANRRQSGISEIVVYDDVIDADRFLGHPVKRGLFTAEEGNIIIATGIMHLRRRLYDAYKGRNVMNFIRSDVDKADKVGRGNLIFPNCEFDYCCKVGNNNVISHNTVINHHCDVGSGNLFGPGCLLSGSVTIGDNCTFGSGVIFQPWVKVADGTTIPSGAVIVGNVSGSIKAKRGRGFLNGVYL
jgi:acetyltransferase-like isoleucine patch superfamily enzyme